MLWSLSINTIPSSKSSTTCFQSRYSTLLRSNSFKNPKITSLFLFNNTTIMMSNITIPTKFTKKLSWSNSLKNNEIVRVKLITMPHFKYHKGTNKTKAIMNKNILHIIIIGSTYFGSGFLDRRESEA